MKHAHDIIKLMPGRIYWKNRQGIYLGCNDQTVQDYGLASEKDFIGKTLYDFHPKAIADRIRTIDEDIMSSGIPKIVEEVVPLLNGGMATLLSHKIPLYDENNQVIGLLGISFDITDRKLQELELKKLKEDAEKDLAKTNIFLKNIIANVPGNLYWKNCEGIYLGTNENNARSAGVSVQDYLGSTVHDLYDKDLAEFFDRVDNEVISTGNPKYIEERAPRLDGTPGIFLTQKVPLRAESGDIMGLLGMSVDITDRKIAEAALKEAKEKAEAANRAKTQFLATVSHELRTPLTGILGMVQALNYVELPNTAREYVKDIQKSADHLLSLINDLLDITKLEAGKMKLSCGLVDFNQLLSQTVPMLIHQAHLKGLTVQTFVDPNIPRYVIGDARALRQIILNLLGNALKFTEKGGVMVRATCQSKTDTRILIALSVEDTGIGIPQEKLGTIFERFMQVDSSFTRRYGGTGLGLSLCKNYVELMDGQISVHSVLGQGSTFTCMIPFIYQKDAHFLAREVQREEVRDFVRETKLRLRALLVEDNSIVQKVHRLFLEELGYQVDIVDCGQSAIEKIKTERSYHVLFLDVGLPDMSGLEVTRLIRDYEAEHQIPELPIIALTAFSLPDHHAECLRVGMNKVLVKPIEIKQLQETLKNLMEDVN